MEDLRLVSLTEFCQMKQGSLLKLWMDENVSEQSNKKITDERKLTISQGINNQTG